MLDAQTFPGIAPAGFAAIAAKVKELTGVVIQANSGTAEAKGYELMWDYKPEDGMLTIQCLSKPRLIPGGMVQKRIRELVGG